METTYDYIIAGGGCAGLSLCHQLLRSETLRDKRILILDREAKSQRDKTWSFWTADPPPFPMVQQHSWERLSFFAPGFAQTSASSPYRYFSLNSLDFYREVQQQIKQFPNVEVRKEEIKEIIEGETVARVRTEQGTYRGNWVFNSLPEKNIPKQEIFLLQHFMGWFIRTDEPAFDPGTATLMDFRVAQGAETRFFYVLPYSETEALVEFTIFSERVAEQEFYQQGLRQYLGLQLGLIDYQILEQERGAIPMTTHSFSRQQGERILNLGTAGGFTKPTTGYTFLNIQRDVQAIVQSLESHRHPHDRPKTAQRFSFYDHLLLYLIQSDGGRVGEIFQQLFQHNELPDILTFLDEQTRLPQELKMLVRLPWGPFFRAIFNSYLPASTAAWFRPGPDAPLASSPIVK